MKLLQVISSLDPRGGGPREVVKQLGRELESAQGFSIDVLTLDAAGAAWVNEFSQNVHALGPGGHGYRYCAALVPWLRQNAPVYDAVIVHGIWQYASFGTWRGLRAARTPYFVFPHGMLDPWFRRRYPLKHLKKLLYWPWAERRVLRDARAVLFTSEEERRQARNAFPGFRCREKVVRYGTAEPPGDADAQRELFLERFPQLRGHRVLLFLGRLHEKKGCELLLEAFARGAGATTSDAQPLALVFAGPCAVPAYQRKLEALASTAGAVYFTGMLTGDSKWGALHAAEAFVLPSHQENFGIAVAEALACGTPVLISNRVNIWREIEAADAGLIAPDDRAGTEELLERWRRLEPERRARMRENARACFRQCFEIGAAARHLAGFLRAAVADGRAAPPQASPFHA